MPEQLLTSAERNRLEGYLAQVLPPVLFRRAQTLLLYDEGQPTREVAAAVGLSRSQTCYWRRQYRVKGIAILRGISETNIDQTPEASSTPEPQVWESEPVQPASPNHAGYIRDLALALFDQTSAIHRLGENQRRLLGEATLRYSLKTSQWKKRSARGLNNLLRSKDLKGFPVEDRSLLAAIIALQTEKLKEKELARLDLSAQGKQDLFALGALLKIASGLDSSNTQGTCFQRVEPGIGGMWVVVAGPQAAADAAVAQQNAHIWVKTGYPPIRVMEAEQAEAELLQYLPLPAKMDAIGMAPGDAMSEAGRKVMYFHFAEMLRHEGGTRLGEDIEALHDMRVATRRLRASFEVFRDVFKPEALKPHLKGLRTAGRALGHVRDLDVFMEKAQHYLETLPKANRQGMEPLLLSWKAQRESARAEMITHLDSPAYQIFKLEFNLFLNTPGLGARLVVPDHPVPYLVREVAPVLIYSRLAAVRAFEPILDNARIDQLHALRIEFKKLRYTVEFFREVLGEEAKAVINELKKLQDHLGDLNDAQIATQILREFLDHWDIQQTQLLLDQRENPEAIVNYLAYRHAERHHLMVTFQDAWAGFDSPEFRNNLAKAVSVL